MRQHSLQLLPKKISRIIKADTGHKRLSMARASGPRIVPQHNSSAILAEVHVRFSLHGAQKKSKVNMVRWHSRSSYETAKIVIFSGGPSPGRLDFGEGGNTDFNSSFPTFAEDGSDIGKGGCSDPGSTKNCTLLTVRVFTRVKPKEGTK